MFYELLLRMQIPNAQKRQSHHQYLLALLGSTHAKAARRKLMKLTPGDERKERVGEGRALRDHSNNAGHFLALF